MADDLYLSNAQDWSFAQRLDESFEKLDFRGLLERYFDLAEEITPEQRARQVAHILSAPDRARQWLERIGPGARRGPILDLGCGSGSFLAALGHEQGELLGVDIALRWLLVARKRLDDAGLSSIRLVCACAERLPLRASCVSAVVAGDVIEHVTHQAATLEEAHRVLLPGGWLVMASPNRFSLAPEPHVGLWGVGFLPRRWMASYVRLLARLDFRAIRTLSLWEWKRLLRRSSFHGGAIRAPELPDTELAGFGRLKRSLGRCYNRLVSTWPGQAVAIAVGPLYHVTCARAAVEPPPPSGRAIHPRSTPQAAARSSAGSRGKAPKRRGG
jgi:SAM-dependent methyltransferase